MFRYLAPSGRYGRCEHSQTLQEAQLSRNASRDSVHSIHVTDTGPLAISAPSGTGPGTSSSAATVIIPVSGGSHVRDPAIRRQHSQPESSCMYCQTHRYMYVTSFLSNFLTHSSFSLISISMYHLLIHSYVYMNFLLAKK